MTTLFLMSTYTIRCLKVNYNKKTVSQTYVQLTASYYVPRKGLEPLTLGLENRRSIQLSYRGLYKAAKIIKLLIR